MRRESNHTAMKFDAEQLESRILLAGFNVDFDMLETTDYTDTEILVRFNDNVQIQNLETLSEAPSIPGAFEDTYVLTSELGEGFRSDSQLFEIPVAQDESVEDLVNYYNSLGIVEYAEPNYRMESMAVPNDQFYGVQWGFDEIGAEQAWDTRTDSSSITVGVIDSGVEYTHPDLVDNIWTNSGEIAGNGIDDDNNGYVDDFYGYDFDNDDNDPLDDNGHGTHVAGTIGATSNNSIGVAGVGWNASLMSLKVIGGGSNADVARAIDYATDNGAQITNNSYGYAGNNVGGSAVMSDAIGRAKDAGVLYVVAAGNSRTGIPASDMDGSFNSWPAEYSKVHDNVITVAAIDENTGSGTTFASYSHWGVESVQIAAPGTQIGSTYTDGRYVYLSGTSMAAPHVAGAAALLWAERPDMSYLEIKEAILSTAKQEHLDRVGSGALDLAAAMDLITSGANGDPDAVNDSATVVEDGQVSIAVLANDSDPDEDSIIVDSFTSPNDGTVTESNNILTYTPDADFNGSDSFTYTISDGNGGFDTATVTITVAPVNDNPVANDDSVTTNEDNSVDIEVIDNDSDVDGDTLAVDTFTQPSDGTVSESNGILTYTPDLNFNGEDSFTYTVSDGNGGTDTATVSVTVDSVNDDPVANDDLATTDEDTNVNIGVLGNDTDVDGDELTIDSFTDPSNGALVEEDDGTFTYTPDADFNGSDSFTYTISDGNGGTDTATVTITVDPVNDNPVASDDSVTTDEDSNVNFNVLTNDEDVDGDELNVDSFTDPANGLLVEEDDGTFTYIPDAGFNGSDSFSYTVSDGNGGTDTATVTITVNEENDAPVANDDSATTDEDTSVNIDVLGNDTDVDGDDLTVDSFTDPSNGVLVEENDGTFTYSPDADFNGSDSFTYSVSDGKGGTDTATVTITVNPVNDGPVANDDSANTDEDTSVNIDVLLNDTDVDGDDLTVDSFTDPSNGTLVEENDGTFTYTPAADFNGSDSFTYTVDDGNGGTDTATVTITVDPVNDDPVANNDSTTTDEDTSVNIDILLNDSDVDGDDLTVDSFTDPSNGTLVEENDGTFSYTPDADFNGSDSFTYTVDDGNGGTDTATVTITVDPVNDAPAAGDDSATTDQDTEVDIDLLNNDSDVDEDSLSISQLNQPSNGSVVDNGDGTVTYTPDAGFFGVDTFTYTVSDGSLTDTATVDVTVNETGDDTIEVGFSGIATGVNHVWKTIELPVSFTNPVVVTGGVTRVGGHQGVPRIRNVTSTSFEIRFQEWDYRDGNHAREDIGYLVVEAGEHTLTDGTKIVAATSTLTNEATRTINFGSSFGATPLVLGQVMTVNDDAAVIERIRNINSSSFQVQMQEEEAADGRHSTETFGYIAIDLGAAVSGETSLNAVRTGNSVTHRLSTVNFGSIDGASNPVILSDMQTRDGGDAAVLRHRSSTSTSVTVWVEEETSRDSERNHTTEVAGILALESGLLIAANPQMSAVNPPSNIGSSLNSTVETVSQSEVDSLVDDAISYWSSQGFNTIGLNDVDVVVTNLRNNVLGTQFGNTIYIDADAAANGWYVDNDTSTTESFAGMDLYSTLTHEFGHVLGLQDTYSAQDASDVMFGYLSSGERSDSLVETDGRSRFNIVTFSERELMN